MFMVGDLFQYLPPYINDYLLSLKMRKLPTQYIYITLFHCVSECAKVSCQQVGCPALAHDPQQRYQPMDLSALQSGIMSLSL